MFLVKYMSLVSFSPGFLCGPTALRRASLPSFALRPAQVVLPEEIGTQKLPFGVLGRNLPDGPEEMPQVYGTFLQSWMMAEWWIPKFMAHCGNFLMVEWWQNGDWRWDSYVYIKVNMMINCINCINCIKLSGTLFSGRPKVKLDSSVLFQLCLFAANDSGWWSPMTSVRLCFFSHRSRM